MIHKYTLESVSHGKVVDKPMIDWFYGCIKMSEGKIARGMNDHFLLEGRIKVNGRFFLAWEKEYSKGCAGCEYKMVSGEIDDRQNIRRDVGWEVLWDSMQVCAQEVYGRQNVWMVVW